MKQKILIVFKTLGDKTALEEIFQELAEKGVELLFTDSQEKATHLLHSEHPQLCVADRCFAPLEGHNIVWIQDRKEKGEGLSRPFHPHQVLEACRSYLDFSQLKQAEELPM